MSTVDLLRNIFSVAVFGQQADGIVLLPQQQQNEAGFVFPQDLFPDSCHVEYLPDNDQYLGALRETLERLKPQAVLIWPMMVRSRFLPESLRKDFGQLDLHEVALLQAVETLSTGSRLGMVLPYGLIRSFRMVELRRRLSRYAAVELVLSHNGPLVQLDVGLTQLLSFGTFVLTVGKAQKGLRFFRHPTEVIDGEERDIVADLRRLLRQDGGTSHYGYVVRDELPADALLLFERHHPDLLRREREMEGYGTVRPLSSLARIERGSVHPARSADVIPVGTDVNDHGALLIEGRMILPTSEIDLENARYRVPAKPEQLLQSGDLIVTSITPPHSLRLRVARYDKQHGPAVAAESILIVRPTELEHEDQEILLAYLVSEKAVHSLRARGLSTQLHARILSGLPVPVFDSSLRLAYRSLVEAAAQFDQWRAEVELARNKLFVEASVQVERFQLLSLGRRARQRCEAGLLVDDFRHRLRTQYPHPIAYRWRIVETARPDMEGYVHILESVEATVCYLASMALLVARLQQKRIPHLEVLSQRWASSRAGGTTMGDWVKILVEVSSALQKMPTDKPVPFWELVAIMPNNEAHNAIERLKNRRNDQAHGRGPKGDEIPVAFEEAFQEFEILLRGIEFLTEYPLRYIESTRRDSLIGQTHYEYRELMGDHPLVPRHSSTTGSSELEAQSLYLVDRNSDLHLLRPLLSRRICPACGQAATFYLDSFNSKAQQCRLKALEHSHPSNKGTVIDDELAHAFRHIGLVL